jgi:tRNA(Ile2) C34 agmatinyltransferase TiaS
MLDRQNQGPQCTACGSPMKLSAIEPSSTGQDLRTFTCPECKRVQRHVIESAVTEAWLEPKQAVKVHSGNAITHEIHDGYLIAKPAR